MSGFGFRWIVLVFAACIILNGMDPACEATGEPASGSPTASGYIAPEVPPGDLTDPAAEAGAPGMRGTPLGGSGGDGIAAAGISESVETAGAEPPEPAEMKQRHAAHGVACADCHADDMPRRRVPTRRCFECHGGYHDMAVRTAEAFPNPHESHAGQVRCGRCHREHSPSELYCNRCHVFEMVVP